MLRHSTQDTLFSLPAAFPTGLVYRPDFLSKDEEEVLITYIQNLPLTHPIYKDEYEAKRRHIGYGWGWDYRNERFIKGDPLPQFLEPAKRKIAKWLNISPSRVVEALINEYTPGSAIGWHVDNEGFEHIIGVSLGNWCRMKFRPLRPKGQRDGEVVSIELEARSAYIMQKEIRWQWQHSIPRVEALRYSITFRTLPS